MADRLVVAKIVFNDLPALSDKLRAQASRVVRKAAHDVEAHAKRVVPVDTGNLKNSIGARMESDLSAVVGTHVHYAVFVEYGTYKMAARPYLGSAAEAVQPSFTSAMTRVLND